MARRSPRCSPLALAAACLLVACLRENPAYKSTGTSASTDDTGDESGSTGDMTCPDGQPPRDWYPDADEDGHGDKKAEPVQACDAPPGHVESHDDCKDDVASVHPGAEEICNERDDDCDGPVDGPQCGDCKIQTTGKSVYWICPVPESDPPIAWDDARARCKTFSSRFPVDLVSIHSDEEHEVVITAVQAYLKRGEDSRLHAWIGLTRNDDENSCTAPDDVMTWKWSDSSAVDHTEWNDPQPTGTDGCECGQQGCQRERCVELSIDTKAKEYGWNDAPCDAELVRGFVCKTKRDPDLFPGG